MGNKTLLLNRYAQIPEDRPLLGWLLDLAQTAQKRRCVQHSRFLDPRQQLAAQTLLTAAGEPFLLWGGFEGAERRIAFLLPERGEYDPGESDVIALLEAKTATQGLTHRDYLGALMGLKLERELIGDILVEEKGAQFFVCREMVPFLLDNFSGAGRARLNLTELPLSDLRAAGQEPESRRATVSSLRLDCLAAAAFRLSRSDATEAIQSGRLLLDGLPCDKPDRLLEEGRMLTLRGRGRVRLERVEGLSRKDRVQVELLIW